MSEAGPTRMHQINESDLAELERELPEVMRAVMPQLDTRTKMRLRRMKSILSDVRWGYGPPTQSEVVDARQPD